MTYDLSKPVAEKRDEDGILYELYRSAKGSSGMIHFFDIDSGNTIGKKQYMTFDQAQKAFDKLGGAE